jgi:hypothetical protein
MADNRNIHDSRFNCLYQFGKSVVYIYVSYFAAALAGSDFSITGAGGIAMTIIIAVITAVSITTENNLRFRMIRRDCCGSIGAKLCLYICNLYCVKLAQLEHHKPYNKMNDQLTKINMIRGTFSCTENCLSAEDGAGDFPG